MSDVKVFGGLEFCAASEDDLFFAERYGEQISSGVITAYRWKGNIYVTDIEEADNSCPQPNKGENQ